MPSIPTITDLYNYFSPQDDDNRHAMRWVWIGSGVLSILAGVSINAQKDPIWRLLSTAAMFGCGVQVVRTQKALERDTPYRNTIKEVRIDKFAHATGEDVNASMVLTEQYYAQFLPTPPQQPQPQPEYDEYDEEQPEHYQEYQQDIVQPNNAGLLPFIAEQIIEESTGIGLLGNSGSGKSCIIQLLASALPDNQILVLDPHADDEDPHYPWRGLTVINQYKLIVEQLEILLNLLTQRDKTALTIICDEWPAVRAYCKVNKLKTADEFIIRYGSEARKFKKLPIFASQAGNTKAMGLEGMGDFLENFTLIRLNKIARKYAKNLTDRSVIERLKQTAYCCLINDDVYQHPTHGHHPRVVKGAKPIGLTPLSSLPLTIPLVIGAKSRHSSRQEKQNYTQQTYTQLDDDDDAIDVEVVSDDPPHPPPPTKSPTVPIDSTHQSPPLIYKDDTNFPTTPTSTHHHTTTAALTLVEDYLTNPTDYPRGLFYGNDANTNFEIFRILKSRGMNKADTIYACWRVVKSGTDETYKLCSQRYEEMLAMIAQSS